MQDILQGHSGWRRATPYTWSERYSHASVTQDSLQEWVPALMAESRGDVTQPMQLLRGRSWAQTQEDWL